MTTGTTGPDALQKAMNDLAEYCNNNGLTVNIVRTKIIKFRSGGRLAKHDHFHNKGKEIEIVNNFWSGPIHTTIGQTTPGKPVQEIPGQNRLNQHKARSTEN